MLQQQMEAERGKIKVIVPKSPEKVAKFVTRSFSLIKSLIKSLRGPGKKLHLVTNPLSWQHWCKGPQAYKIETTGSVMFWFFIKLY